MFRQIVSWLETECPVLEDCVHTVAAPGDLMHLLQHHKRLGHLEQHGQSHTKATFPLHGEKIVTKGVFFPPFGQSRHLAWATRSSPRSLQHLQPERPNM